MKRKSIAAVRKYTILILVLCVLFLTLFKHNLERFYGYTSIEAFRAGGEVVYLVGQGNQFFFKGKDSKSKWNSREGEYFSGRFSAAFERQGVIYIIFPDGNYGLYRDGRCTELRRLDIAGTAEAAASYKDLTCLLYEKKPRTYSESGEAAEETPKTICLATFDGSGWQDLDACLDLPPGAFDIKAAGSRDRVCLFWKEPGEKSDEKKEGQTLSFATFDGTWKIQGSRDFAGTLRYAPIYDGRDFIVLAKSAGPEGARLLKLTAGQDGFTGEEITHDRSIKPKKILSISLFGDGPQLRCLFLGLAKIESFALTGRALTDKVPVIERSAAEKISDYGILAVLFILSFMLVIIGSSLLARQAAPLAEKQVTAAGAVMEFAGLFERAAALMIDSLLIAFISFAVLMPFGVTPDISSLLDLVLIQVVFMSYMFICEAARGQSVGKWLVRIKVVGRGGENPTAWQAFLRNIMRIIDAFPVLYIVGISFFLASKNSQRLGDILSDTFVIRLRKEATNDSTA